MNLTEEEQLTLPLLLGLLDTEKTMNAVEWIKSVLMDEFDYSKDDLNPHPHFVHIQPTLNSQDQLLILVAESLNTSKKDKPLNSCMIKKGRKNSNRLHHYKSDIMITVIIYWEQILMKTQTNLKLY